MNFRPTRLAVLIACAAAPAAAVEPPGAERPLRPIAECLDPDRARAWHLIDSDEVLVDAGRRRFHLQLGFSCPELAYNHEVVFQPGTAVGRLCGFAGDRIAMARPGPRTAPCIISTVTPLTKAQYDAYLENGKPSGSVTVRDDAAR